MFLLVILLNVSHVDVALSWDNQVTHMDLSKYAVNSSSLRLCTNTNDKQCDYLKNLDINAGLKEVMKWNNATKSILDWLEEGANYEDDGSKLDSLKGNARFNNHFHHPLKPWVSAGLNDIQTGESSVLWAQDGAKQTTTVGGDWSWNHIRGFYFRALTSTTDAERQVYFAQTFRGLGQQIHLIQDAAVPAHVRNDAHPLDAMQHYHTEFVSQYFESWAKDNSNKINSFATNTVIFPTVSFEVFHNDSTLGKDLTPITQLIDTDQYTGMNPSASFSIGLAEYTNANFFSDDTIFATETYAADHKHFSPFPRQNSTNLQSLLDQSLLPEVVIAFDGKPDVGFWIQKVRDGENTINHFVKPTYTWMKLLKKIQVVGSVYLRSFYIDEMCNEDYARLLIPRAVGYSAALLNYFFRGQINLELHEDDPSQYVISNDSDEPLHGVFSLYYDDKTGNRKLYKTSVISSGVATVEAHSTSNPFTFDDPTDAQSPGTFMLVFQGTMGNENGAVVGRVVKLKKIEITAPDRCLFAITDGAKLPQQFTMMTAKVRPTNFDGAIQSGTLQAIAKYKERIDYQPDLSADPPTAASRKSDFSYSTSAPITLSADDIAALNGTSQKAFTFDFSGSAIPAGITDLYLNVLFTGTVDNATDTITAFGIKDLSEPMHLIYWNDTDRFELYGHLYSAETIINTPSLMELIDQNHDGLPDANIYPHPVAVNIQFCPNSDADASYNIVYDNLLPGTFGRVITIVDSAQTDTSIRADESNVYFEYSVPNIMNQDENGDFKSAPIYRKRGITGHLHIERVSGYPPNWAGPINDTWPDVPAGSGPVPAKIIRP